MTLNNYSYCSLAFNCENCRFSAIAAERVNSPRPSSTASSQSARRPGREVRSGGSVQKASGQRRPNRRNDGRMDVDTEGKDGSDKRDRNPRGDNRGSNRAGNRSQNKNSRNARSKRPGRREEKKPLSQTDLDKDLEAYMMKNTTTAQATLDMDIDAYMAGASSKN